MGMDVQTLRRLLQTMEEHGWKVHEWRARDHGPNETTWQIRLYRPEPKTPLEVFDDEGIIGGR